MTSSRIVSACARRNIHYGWVVVAVTFLVLLVTAGAMGTPGVMIVPLENEFGWSDAQISSALALRILLFGLFGPFAACHLSGDCIGSSIPFVARSKGSRCASTLQDVARRPWICLGHAEQPHNKDYPKGANTLC